MPHNRPSRVSGMETPGRDGRAGAPRNDPRRSPERQGHPSAIPREARPFQGLRAGLVSRMLAGTVDLIVVAVVVLAGYLVVAGMRFLWRPANFRFPSPSLRLLLIAGLALLIPYLSLSWWLTGRTYGDHIFGLRVINVRGQHLRLGGAVMRAAFCVALPIGLLWVACSRQDRSVQDLVLRTSVIYDWEVRSESKPETRRR
ncbi:MAG TPA: RDD family protein [Kineosporiaceae bacterium]|nr:RDD family protein [Kineosporiaceae bacterium]